MTEFIKTFTFGPPTSGTVLTPTKSGDVILAVRQEAEAHEGDVGETNPTHRDDFTRLVSVASKKK